MVTYLDSVNRNLLATKPQFLLDFNDHGKYFRTMRLRHVEGERRVRGCQVLGVGCLDGHALPPVRRRAHLAPKVRPFLSPGCQAWDSKKANQYYSVILLFSHSLRRRCQGVPASVVTRPMARFAVCCSDLIGAKRPCYDSPPISRYRSTTIWQNAICAW